MEVARTEKLEAELDRIIEKRAADRKDANATEELWKSSSRLHDERRRRENGAAWYSHHCVMSDVHRRLAEEHEAEAMKLLDSPSEEGETP